jgi:drug/metabolite transporter (DMT)-like permease
MFMGGLLLLAALISWFTGLAMSPHGQSAGADSEHIRTSVVVFLRNSAIGNLILAGLAGWLLFPPRRPRWPARDYAIMAALAIVVLTSLYQLVWLWSVTR